MRWYGIPFLLCYMFCLGACNKTTVVKPSSKKPPLIHLAHLPEGWYSHNPTILLQDLEYYFQIARQQFPMIVDTSTIRALIVPHAGMYFSGVCAASAYQSLLEGEQKNKTIKHVIILCPSHTAFLKGCALPLFDTYKMVLGDIAIDQDAIELLKTGTVFKGDSRIHEQEHAIEIQLPFLQKTIADFTLIPIIVGHVTYEDIKDIIHGLTKIITNDTLVIISSDFIHHGPSYEYNVFDRHVINNIRYFDSLAVNALSAHDYNEFDRFLKKTGATICGQNPLKIFLGLLNKRIIDGVNARLTCYYTSAHMNKARQKDHKINVTILLQDISDQESRESVSYIGMVFTTQNYHQLSKEDVLTGYEKKALLATARRTIINAFVDKKDRLPDHLLYPIVSFGMQQISGAFVTLHKKAGDLRGCIGDIETQEPLFQTIIRMSVAAAFEDTRFSPLTKEELNDTVIDISLLTPPHKVDHYKDIIIGKHGIILKKLDTSGKVIASSVFLPQVARDYGWTLEETLEHLSSKAGLSNKSWKNDCVFEVFEGYEIKE
jgi:AmmeMemoRadiSam system protein B/AmmeMemoRadiSam system protein A